MPDPAMTAEEAGEMVDWAQNTIAVRLTPWQRDMLARMFMYPSLILELTRSRNGR